MGAKKNSRADYILPLDVLTRLKCRYMTYIMTSTHYEVNTDVRGERCARFRGGKINLKTVRVGFRGTRIIHRSSVTGTRILNTVYVYHII